MRRPNNAFTCLYVMSAPLLSGTIEADDEPVQAQPLPKARLEDGGIVRCLHAPLTAVGLATAVCPSDRLDDAVPVSLGSHRCLRLVRAM
jgi:hypothetical protein